MAKIILTADDSPSVRQLIGFILSNAGYQVIEASDGKEALAKMASSPVNLLLTDLNMPNLDGIGLIRQVRMMPQYKYIPIIMLTTESQDEKKQAGKAAGASGWIVKPFRAEQLLLVAKKFLG